MCNIFVSHEDDSLYRLILNLKHVNDFGYTRGLHGKNCHQGCILQCANQICRIKNALSSHLTKSFIYFPGTRKFTKLLKPSLSTMRKQGGTVAAYIDDMIIKTERKCRNNIFKILRIFESLRFVIHPYKSTFIPSTSLEFLGFIIDSKHMTVSLTIALKREIIENFGAVRVSIRKFARFRGKFTSNFIAVPPW